MNIKIIYTNGKEEIHENASNLFIGASIVEFAGNDNPYKKERNILISRMVIAKIEISSVTVPMPERG